jgi:hypothetical protein
MAAKSAAIVVRRRSMAEVLPWTDTQYCSVQPAHWPRPRDSSRGSILYEWSVRNSTYKYLCIYHVNSPITESGRHVRLRLPPQAAPADGRPNARAPPPERPAPVALSTRTNGGRKAVVELRDCHRPSMIQSASR